MTKLQTSKLQTFSTLCDFFNRRADAFNQGTFPGIIARFQMKTLTLVVITQHESIVKKGIDRDVPAMKDALCNLAFEMARTLYLRGKTSIHLRGLVKKPTSPKYLARKRDDLLITYCMNIHKIADRYKINLRKAGVESQAIATLKAAAEMYNAIVPPPRSMVLLAQHYNYRMETLFTKLDKTLVYEIDPLVQKIQIQHPVIFKEYSLIFKNGSQDE
jgi:hypothetical protein